METLITIAVGISLFFGIVFFMNNVRGKKILYLGIYSLAATGFICWGVWYAHLDPALYSCAGLSALIAACSFFLASYDYLIRKVF